MATKHYLEILYDKSFFERNRRRKCNGSEGAAKTYVNEDGRAAKIIDAAGVIPQGDCTFKSGFLPFPQKDEDKNKDQKQFW